MSGQFVMKGHTIQEANYKTQTISAYKHNPYIEALPDIYDIDSAAVRIRRLPSYDPKERLLPDTHRIHSVWSLSDYIKPMPRHITLENSISIAIRQGYKSRNPLKAEWVRQMREAFDQLDWMSDDYEPLIRSTASGFALLGLSGVGKSTAIESVLGLYPQVIQHKEFNGVTFPQKQVVWLKLECPYNGSIKGLCLDFFRKLDEAADTNYFKKFNKRQISIDSLVIEMGLVANAYGLGILVIDEIQRLSEAKSGGAKSMMNFFVRLINHIGLPVVLVGTPKSTFLFDDLALARRNEGFGTDLWLNYPKDEVWDNFIRSLWKYQWTNVESPLDPTIEKAIYDCTQGIPDFAVKLYMLVQWKLIGEGNEKITSGIIRKIAKDYFKLAQPILNAIKNRDTKKLMSFNDIPHLEMKKQFEEAIEKNKLRNNVSLKRESEDETPVFKIAKLLIQSGIEDIGIAKECAIKAAALIKSEKDFKEAVHFALKEALHMELDNEIDHKKEKEKAKKTSSKRPPSKEEIQEKLISDKQEGTDLLKV